MRGYMKSSNSNANWPKIVFAIGSYCAVSAVMVVAAVAVAVLMLAPLAVSHVITWACNTLAR